MEEVAQMIIKGPLRIEKLCWYHGVSHILL